MITVLVILAILAIVLTAVTIVGGFLVGICSVAPWILVVIAIPILGFILDRSVVKWIVKKKKVRK